MELINGHKLQNGEYRIEKKIGQGGFGITYLARWYQKIQGAMGSAHGYSMVIIKEFFWSKYCSRDADGYTVSISSSEGKEMMAQFKKKLKKEGKIISKFSHPNIVKILEIFEENNTAYLVMQYIEGESLSEKLKREGKIDEPAALKYTEQICSALTEIHGKRILHLDIKPGNVLIDEDDNVQLIDFGISKQYDESAKETSDTPIGISAGYSPVEQYGALKSFSPPTDIYAVGATLYKMLTGETPLEATARNQYDLVPMSHYTNVDKRTEEAVAKAMSEKIRDRFQTAEEFWQALNGESEPEAVEENLNEQSAGITVIDIPQSLNPEISTDDETRIDETPLDETPVDDTIMDKQPDESETAGIAVESEPKKHTLWKNILFGTGVAAAVFSGAIYFYSGKGKSDDVTPEDALSEHVVTNAPAANLNTGKTTSQTQTNPPRESSALSTPAKEPQQTQASDDERLRIEKEKAQKEKEEKQKKAAELIQQANNIFDTGSGPERYAKAFQLYKQAKNLGGNVSGGRNRFASKASFLMEHDAKSNDKNITELQKYVEQLR